MDSLLALSDGNELLSEQKLKFIHEDLKSCNVTNVTGKVVNLLIDADIVIKLKTIVGRLLKFAEVPEFPSREYYDYQECDFEGATDKTIIVVDILYMILAKCETETVRCLYEANRGYFIMIIMANFSTSLWSTKLCVEKSQKMMTVIVDSYGLPSFKDLLVFVDDHGISPGYACLLSLVQKHFTKKLWKRNPVIMAVFTQSLQLVSYPHLSDYTDKVLPPCFIMNDDHETKHKTQAVTCLIHIIDNITGTELMWQRRIDVIYDALKHNLLLRKCDLTKVTIACMIRILNVMEKNVKRYDSVHLCPKHHEVFAMMLREAEMESHWDLRRVYAENLSQFIDLMGLHVLRHSTSFLNVLRNYLEVSDHSDEFTRLWILHTMSRFIDDCWPRIPVHCESLLKMLLKLMYDISASGGDSRKLSSSHSLRDKALGCLNKLHTVCPLICSETLQSVIALECNEKFTTCLKGLVSHW